MLFLLGDPCEGALHGWYRGGGLRGADCSDDGRTCPARAHRRRTSWQL